METQSITQERCVVRNTAGRKGRTRSVAPGVTASRHLHDMPAPSFGVQLVYTNPREPELATIVREGDVVLMPEGYHPNVAAPGGAINFLWMMAANREQKDRQFGVVNVQPEFGSTTSGLDRGRADR